VETIKIVIADDHPAFREGLNRLINDDKALEVVGLAGDGESLVALSKNLNPNIAIIDISMPKLNGIEAIKLIKKYSPGTYVLILSAYGYPSFILASLQAGADGFLTKDTPIHEIISAIHLISTGDSLVTGREAENCIHDLISYKNHTVYIPNLHSREIAVLRLVAKGMRSKQIARELNISIRTVQAHLINIFNKLDAHSRTEAVIQALKHGWLDYSDISN
jgi:NarL family two-component system response regulator LiaR